MDLKIPTLHTIGQTYHHFTVTKALPIPELQCFLLELVHNPTGAHVMHLANDDPENLFCLSFQTLPNSSNGVAHILEHTVLCGSHKFPVKDPFFAMTRRSLNTFMNAFTGSDFTCYPASSQVPKDFYNLLDVYIDAVFKPNLDKFSFLQEGHRLEFAIPSDPTSPLEYKGIVYNEMKGAMASGSARLAEALNHALFPDLTYGVNSGGEPKIIPTLTYEQLCSFHKQYYHPSRCLFFFYGNMPLEGHLDFIAEMALKNVKKAEPLPPIPRQPRFTKPHYADFSYPIAPDEDPHDKTLIAFGWLTCHILEQQELTALEILEIVLMDTDASPLKMALLRSGLCKQASSYIDDDITEAPFVISIKGCNADKADQIEDLIKKTLEEIAYQGIPYPLFENAIHQLEFHRSEITGDSAPFGLSLFMRSGLQKQHGATPEDSLIVHSTCESLRQFVLEDPRYLSKLIIKYLINNPHFVRVIMTPDKELSAKELIEERIVLDNLRAQLNDKQVQGIVNTAAELADFQKKQEEEDPDILPKVTLSDVPKAARDFLLTQEKIGNLQVFHHTTFTNEIVYADLVFNLPEIAQEDLPYVRLLTTLMSQMGCNGRDYAQNLDYIQANTGGIGASLTLNLQAQDHNLFYPSFYLRGKALHRKANKLFPLILEMASSTDFSDKSRLKEVLLKHHTALQSSLNQSALKYAINLSASGIDVPSKIANAWYGLDYYHKIHELVQDFDKQSDVLIEKLKFLQNAMTCLENPHLVLTCDQAMYDQLKEHSFYGLQNISTKPFKPWTCNPILPTVEPQGRIIASPIAFTSIVFKTVSYVHPDAAALNIAASLFDNLTLHTRIREQGGAYGGGAVSNAMSGNFYFYSYRDPNIYKTVQAFHDAVQTIAKGRFDDDDLEEAKLEMIQSLDSPVAPGSRGDRAYGWFREGKTHAIRQAFRDRVLSLKREDVENAVKQHIIPNMNSGALVAFAGKELLEKENLLFAAHDLPPLKIYRV